MRRFAPFVLLVACGGSSEPTETPASTAAGGGGGQAGQAGSVAKAGAAGSQASGSGGAGAAGQAGAAQAGAAGAAGSTAGAAGKAGGAPVDACSGKAAACPGQKAWKEGGGLVEIDRCAFPIAEKGFASYASLVSALEGYAFLKPVGVAGILADLNRDAKPVATVPGAPPGVKHAFTWQQGDVDVAYWTPQGLSGSPDATAAGLVAGRKVLLASWYYTQADEPGSTIEKGVRVAFVDVTDPTKPKYRFALLVEPKGPADAPTYTAVNLHAGGIAWYGDQLYVADTGKGFRVFDLTHAWSVSSGDGIGCTGSSCSAAGYAYVIPQIGSYQVASSCDLLFSYVSLDRSTDPPALVSGEYCSTSACADALGGRVLRWPLDPATGRLAPGTSWPSGAWVMQQAQVQGAAMRAGLTFLSSSAPAGGGGALYRVTVGKSKTTAWIDSPEDLMVDGPAGLLWGQSEAQGARFFFGAALSSYPAP